MSKPKVTKGYLQSDFYVPPKIQITSINLWGAEDISEKSPRQRLYSSKVGIVEFSA